MCLADAASPTGPTRTLAVVTAGVSEPSATSALASALARATVRAAAARGVAARPELVEIRDCAGDLAQMMVTGVASPRLARAIETVTRADALIAVSPTFASSYAGIFKLFFDVLDPASLAGRPTVLGATGGSVRHSLIVDHALRPLFAYFHAAVTPTGVFATPAELAATRDDVLLTERIDRAGRELAEALPALPGADPEPEG